MQLIITFSFDTGNKLTRFKANEQPIIYQLNPYKLMLAKTVIARKAIIIIMFLPINIAIGDNMQNIIRLRMNQNANATGYALVGTLQYDSIAALQSMPSFEIMPNPL